VKPGLLLDGRFEIERIAGKGGAGVVYRGIDRTTGQPVAIKTARSADSEDARFAREAATLAALRHPAIVGYLHHGSVEDEPYLVMEWLEGEDLGARLASSRLELLDAICVARQIAGALAAAHEKGVIHRDVKPSNVFLVNRDLDQVRLIDFGLARTAGATSLTATGTVLGTPSYMAPEQARGDHELDTRVDVYGLGALLFHCIAGRPPFEGSGVEQVIARIINEPAPRLAALVPGISAELDALVARMLSKDPLRRPADGRAAHAALVGLGAPASAPAPALDDTQLPAPHTVTLAREIPPEVTTPASSIAVLSFLDMSPDRDQGYLCDGIADELIDALGNIEGLRVAARISSFWFKSSAVDAREIGRRLGVEAILEGGVRVAGTRLRVTVQLVDVATGYQRWSHRFEGTLDDVFAIQDEIATRVATALRGLLSNRDKQAMRRPGAAVDAYSDYLRARQLLLYMSPTAYRTAVELFESAIANDPSYAPAYAGLAELHARYFEWSYGGQDARAAADRASLRALELAPHATTSHVARAQVLKMLHRYEEARAEFDEAIRTSPNDFEAHHLYGRLFFEVGDIEASAQMFRRASELRVEDYQTPLLLAQSLRRLGRLEEGHVARIEGIERVERQLALWPDDARALALGAAEIVHDGEAERERALAWVVRAAAAAPDDPSVWYNIACTYAGLQMQEPALEWLGKTFEIGMGVRAWVEHDPDFDFLRDDPRFQAMVAKLS